MSHSSETQSVLLIDFFQKTLPFSGLNLKDITALSQQCSVDFFPAKICVLHKDSTMPEDLLLVQSGGIKLSMPGEDGREILIDYRGEGSCVGELSLIQDAPATMNAHTVEDTFVIRLPGAVFKDLLRTQPLIAEYFLRSFSSTYLSQAFSDINRRTSLQTDSGLHFFGTEVGSMISREPVSVEMATSIQLAALKMTQHGVGSLLVRDPSGEVSGIVTDKDIRKAVGLGMDYTAPVKIIMSTPLVSVTPQTAIFDALLKMMTLHIHHLVVTPNNEQSDNAILGVVTSHDIMLQQGKNPLAVFREILGTETLQGLYPLSSKISTVVRSLVEEGAKAGNISRMVAVFNDLILERLLDLLIKQFGTPPLPFCWLLMGSEGRREQTFATDQDNALVYKDSDDEILQRACDIYFTEFTAQAKEHLIQCGFPACPGNIMASNPKLRKPLSLWRDRFEHWIMVPEPEEVLQATIFFDFRAGYGHENFAKELRNHIMKHAPKQDVFLRCLAADCLKTRPPLSFFKNFLVERSGEHKNQLDIKTRGLTPFIDFARLMALKYGLKETNTLARLKLLSQEGHIPQELCVDATEAYEFLLHLRLVHQLTLVEQGKKANNHIIPEKLSELERRTLKEAFGVISRIQRHVRDIFSLNIA